jgi:hypothetical protein
MTVPDTPATTTLVTPTAVPSVLAPPSWAWRRAALFLAGAAQLIVGIAGGITHIGLFFVPALAVLAVATARLRRERP